uniref:Uncharacterized protein n=1 Tax=Rhizophora mucronata TaxID=61149 RepID=A0A2P2P087_RHIMU
MGAAGSTEAGAHRKKFSLVRGRFGRKSINEIEEIFPQFPGNPGNLTQCKIL